MKKNFLFKGVSALGAMLLLATSVMPGLQYAYAQETYTYSLGESASWDYIYDEASWNNSYQNGYLNKYYTAYPSEDLWNTKAHRAAIFDDRHYVGTIDNQLVECDAKWESSTAQKLVIGEHTYYAGIFYDTSAQEIDLYNDAALNQNANKKFNITEITYKDCTQSWEGAINAPGAKYPWVAVNLSNFEGTIKFSYEGKSDVYPWGENTRLFAKGGTASIPVELGDEFLLDTNGDTTFDPQKLTITLLPKVACIEKGENDDCYGSLRAAVNNATDNDEIYLVADDEVSFDSSNLEIRINDKKITIDGDNHYIQGVTNAAANKNDWHDIYISGTKDVTIKNLTIKDFGKDVAINRYISPIYVGHTYSGKLTLDKVTIDTFNRQAIHIGNGQFDLSNLAINGSNGSPYQQGIEIFTAANGTIKNSSIDGIKGSTDWEAYAIGNFGNGTVTVTDTTVTNSDYAAGVGSVPDTDLGYTDTTGKLSLGAGNNFTATNVLEVSPSADGYTTHSTIEVTAGSYNGAIEKSTVAGDASAKIEISGGKFSVDPSTPVNYLVTGKSSILSDGKYNVVDSTTVAVIGDTQYPSLRAAVNAAGDGDTIKLLADDTTSFDSSNLEIRIKDKQITVDGDNHYIQGVANAVADKDNWHDIYVSGTKDVTIKNLTIKDFGKDVAINRYISPIYVGHSYSGKLTLDKVTISTFNRQAIHIGNGQFDLSNLAINGSNGSPYQQGIEIFTAANGTIKNSTIDGIKGSTDWEAYAIGNFGNGTVTVTDTTVTNSDYAAGVGSVPDTDLGYTDTTGKLSLGAGNNFTATNVLEVSPSADGYTTHSTIEVTAGSYNGTIEKSTVAGDASAKIEISGGKFSADPSTYVVAGKYAKSISEDALKYEVDVKPSSSSSGGGGGSSKKSETTKTDDAKANTGDTATVDDKNAEDKNDETKADEPKTAVDANNNGTADTAISFSQEFKDAYKFAHDNGITTKDSIEEADMYGPLTRIAMAKMLSQYAINVLGKTPDTDKVVPNFPDVDAQLDADYDNGVTLAYQLGIMGIGIEEFRPFDLVTRAEFGTALSRMLYGTADGEGNEWYSTHLEKLMTEKIITNDNPNLKELRGYVMIMLMRSAQ